jgi:hypothetical protein
MRFATAWVRKNGPRRFDADQAVETLGARVQHVPARLHGDAGIVHETVDAAEGAPRCRDQRSLLGQIGDVARDGGDARARLPRGTGCLVEVRRSSKIVEHEVEAARGKRQRNAAPDAALRARDEGDAPSALLHQPILPCSFRVVARGWLPIPVRSLASGRQSHARQHNLDRSNSRLASPIFSAGRGFPRTARGAIRSAARCERPDLPPGAAGSSPSARAGLPELAPRYRWRIDAECDFPARPVRRGRSATVRAIYGMTTAAVRHLIVQTGLSPVETF